MTPRLYALTLNQPMSSAMMNRMLGLLDLDVAMLGSCASEGAARGARRRIAQRYPSCWSPAYRPLVVPARSASRFEAAGDVVVDESRRLHEGVDDRRADEAHPALLEILG